MVAINNDLNSRQFRLYDYLKAKGDVWTNQIEICCDLKDLYDPFFDDMTFHDSQARHLLTNDIRAINESDYLPKPILSGSRGVKIANEQEFDLYIGSNIQAVIRRLNRLKKLAKKGSRDGQYRIKLSEYQKDIVNAFIDSED